MLQKLQSGRSFEVLASPSFKIAIGEIETKFRDWMANRPTAKRCHENVAMPFKRALARAEDVTLLLNGEGRKGGDFYFIAVGDQVFPMRARKKDWNPAELTIFEPVHVRRFDAKQVDKHGLEALYDKDPKDIDHITVSREHAPTTHVRFKETDTLRDESYGWALWEASSALIRRVVAREEAKAPKKVFDPVLEQDVDVKAPARYGKVASALLGSINKAGAAPAAPGPLVADELLAAFSFNGRPVAVTSQRPVLGADGKATQPSVKIWVQEKRNGQTLWVDLPPPKDAKLPTHGTTAVLDGGTLRLFGGLDADGDATRTHLSYDLAAAFRDRHKPELWRTEAPLEDAVAWPAALATDRETFLAGGVAGFYVKAAEDRDKAKAKVLTHRRDLKVLGRNGWKRRDPFPTDLTGASTAFGKGCLFVGPGNQMSGRIFVFDTDREGASIELPKLPKALGLGQLLLEGSRLLYAGGFDGDGKPSKGVYELDLDDIAPKWKHLGDSAYAQGTARVVEAQGSVISLMIAGGKSVAYDLGAHGRG
ncbi:hypothetical protein L6R52_15655 [Myxococcota bacterium]|nr:hypothetical protein [Myxococcota bacterium]